MDDVLNELIPYLDQGAVIIDGGNSFYRDSIRHEKDVSSKGMYFLDCGTSGGISGARHGACFMVGGNIQELVSWLGNTGLAGGADGGWVKGE